MPISLGIMEYKGLEKKPARPDFTVLKDAATELRASIGAYSLLDLHDPDRSAAYKRMKEASANVSRLIDELAH